ncbi:lysophospholipid acyltransferase family protein [Nitrosomonas cryotolerans]|uniref:Lyso-ornithine lipid acyltransferase n=1 Tax=Nitrosomonas cryotolerans ATCC 49181 TaxID=1131553 RepID=A0A1N6IUJ4_9PROT|nr:lysophospholipid acyltransferase family protein [Nitrosomonas cryotolerans]SIO35693.1 lyso-ornithine lipid acyltransferase [Nitrosomonas cryotolerans ATCC 49181]
MAIHYNTIRNTTRLTVQVIRLARLFLHIVSGLIQSVVYPHFSQSTQRRLMQNWAAGLLAILNIKLHCKGKPPTVREQQVIFAANHVSWLDICVLMAACPTRFVAKAEIRNWPVFGFLSRKVGTLFIERAKRSDTLRMNRHINDVLMTGERVAIFPEGTTSDGTVLRHFHASLFQSAVADDVLLYPIAICYRNVTGEISQEAAYINPSLFSSLRQILGQTRIDTELVFIDPIVSSGKNRRELARLTEQAIANALSLPVSHKEPGKFSGLPAE